MSQRHPPLRGRRILLVDDDPDLRAELASLLRQEGAEVCEAGAGDEALSELAEDGFDLVVTDVVMPSPAGTQVAAMARTAGQEVPILVITAHRRSDIRDVVDKLDRANLLLKPFGGDDFLAEIEKLLAA